MSDRTSFVGILSLLCCVLLLPATPVMADYGEDCSNCGGFFGDACSYSVIGAPYRTGYKYELGAQCARVCNGPEDTNTKTCLYTLASKEVNKYKLTGSIELFQGAFGLTGDWQNEKETISTCTYSDSCNTGGCCVGANYGYYKYSYTQKVAVEYNNTQGHFCLCSATAKMGTLVSNPVPDCGEATEHGDWEPAPATINNYCNP